MYERMLNKTHQPTFEEFSAYCQTNANFFQGINQWLLAQPNVTSKLSFPYGNQYGWAYQYYQKKQLICNIFAEQNAFCVMIRLSNEAWDSLQNISTYAQQCINNRYPCGSGAWVHYRVSEQSHMTDLYQLLQKKVN